MSSASPGEGQGPGRPSSPTEIDPGEPPARGEPLTARPLGAATLAAAYIPDFPLSEVQFWFAPSRSAPREVYHELLGRSADKWDTYYNKKGWRFARQTHPGEREAEGPFRAAPGDLRLRILDCGRFRTPRPVLTLGPEGLELPLVSMEKRRPLNEWKPTYIKALNFIKKYEWPRPVQSEAQLAIWEIEECGEVAGSTSWQNAEMLLRDRMSADIRATLIDLFQKRPEEFPLGSEVYLRVLGQSGDEGFRAVCDLHRLPSWRKRKHVAASLGKLGRPEAVETLFAILDDEEPDVREAALRGLGRVGVPASGARGDRMRELLTAGELAHRVWAAQALFRGGDEAQRKLLIGLVKEEEGLPLSDMGELGEVLAELEIADAAPYLINRLKSDNSEIRADAAEALHTLSGVDVEFLPGDEGSRRQAIRAYTRWWEDLKKDRRRQPERKT